MHASPYPAGLDAQASELRRRLVSQTRALDVLTQLAEQLAALEEQGRTPAWREQLLTTIQERMTKTEAELQETRGREGQS